MNNMNSFDLLALLQSHYSNQTGYVNKNQFDVIEGQIATRLSDPEKAAAIRKAYEIQYTNLMNAWPMFGSQEFKEWLVNESKFLGSLAVDHMELAIKSFPPSLFSDFTNPTYFKERADALNALSRELQNQWGAIQKDQSCSTPNMIGATASKTQKVIAVLFRKCGNGHVTASTGIKQFLEARGYKVHLIDGGASENKIEFTPSRSICKSGMKELRKEIKQIHPDLIISTVAHHNTWTQMGYDLNVPTLVVHTDYEVNGAVVYDDGACTQPCVFENSSLVQYCLPHEDNDQNRIYMKSQLSPQRYQTLVKEMGFPVRESFIRENDPAAIMALRKELGLRNEERAVLMMGHREPDTSKMIELIRKLSTSTRSFAAPICIVAVCGDDPSARKRVEAELKAMPKHPDIRVKMEGYLNEETLAKYMKVVSRASPFPGVSVSKRGGSTTAESTEMGVYTIAIPTIAHEACNGEYSARHGLGEPIDENNFVNQIATAIKWKGTPNDVYKSPFDWRQNLASLVETKLQESSEAKVGKFQFCTHNT